MKKCNNTKCLLYKEGIEVPYSGNIASSIVFVGESPGNNEERLGRPFVGQAGKLLKEDMESFGLEFHRFLLLNSARCKIKKDELGVKEITSILQCCRNKIELILTKVKPKLIVLLGDIAMRQIIKKSGITKNRGVFLWSEEFNCYTLPIFHPAYILRNMSLRPRFQNDLKLVKEFINNDFNIPKIDNLEDYSYLDVDTNFKEFEDSMDELLSSQDMPIISMDTETQGLDVFDPNFVFISYSISPAFKKAFNIVLWEECVEEEAERNIRCNRLNDKKELQKEIYLKKAPYYEFKLNFLTKILRSNNLKKYMMTSFDLSVFSSQGIKVNNFVMDIQAAANIIDENLYSMASLGDLQKGFTSDMLDYKNNFSHKHNKADMLKAYSDDRQGVIFYACKDADLTRQIGLKLKDLLSKDRRLVQYFLKFTMPVIRNVLHILTQNGVEIDVHSLPFIKKELNIILNRYEKEALNCASKNVLKKHIEGKGIALTRGDFVRDILFSEEGFGLMSSKRTKSGASLDKEARQDLRGKRLPGKAKIFLDSYEKYLECHTLLSRYFKGFDSYIKKDNRIHSKFSIVKTVTGRTSSSDPNLQNTPKRLELAGKIRQLIIPKKGYIFIAGDESQSELRWMAHMAREPEMMRVFNASEDIHTNTAKSLSSKSWDTLDKEEINKLRRSAKAVNFGLLYGMKTNGFIKYSKIEYGIDLTEKEANRWIEIFFNTYRKIKNFHSEIINICRRQGYVESCLGRKRRLPEIYSTDQYLKWEAERQAVNHVIQSPSSDTVLLAALKINSMNLDPEDIKLVLFVHDELIFEVRENSNIEHYIKIIKNAMEKPPLEDFGVKLKVPLKADIKTGCSLNDLKEYIIN